jgi:ADP-heptose:LPS heptosyltransferase
VSWLLDDRPLVAILVTRLRYLGDVAMATVVAEVLRRGDARVDLGFLCEEAHAPVLAGQPSLRRVHVLRTPRRSQDARARAHRADPRTIAVAPVLPEDCEPAGGAHVGLPHGGGRMVRELRTARYDLAVDLLFNPRSALLLRCSGTCARVGGRAGWRRRLYTHLAGPEALDADPQLRRLAPGGLGDHLSRLAPLRHGPTGLPFLEWYRQEYAVAPARPRIARPPLGLGAARQALDALGVEGEDGFVLLAPGATWPSKEWPVARWERLVRLLAEQQSLPIVLLSPPLRGELYASLGMAVPPGRGGLLAPLPLVDVLRVVGAASLLVSVDGGVMHAAVAMGRPTVALFGPSDPAIWFPYPGRREHRVLATAPACHPCGRHDCAEFICLPALEAAEVAATALVLLGDGGSGP